MLHNRNKMLKKYVHYFQNIYFNSCGHAVFEFGVDYFIIILVWTQINGFHFFRPPDIFPLTMFAIFLHALLSLSEALKIKKSLDFYTRPLRGPAHYCDKMSCPNFYDDNVHIRF